MKIVRFKNKKSSDGPARMGLLRGDDQVVDLSAALSSAGATVPGAEDLSWFDLAGSVQARVRDFAAGAGQQPALPLADLQLLAPVARPSKVICIGLNYRDHAIEAKMEIPKNPIMFSKFATSIIGPEDPVVIPVGCEKPDYEAEMAVVIGRRCKHVSQAAALDQILGYSCFNDVSARDFQFSDGQWTRGKAADSFAPIGPFIATGDEVPNPGKLGIRFRLNGQVLQDSNTDQLIFGVAELVSFLSRSMTLEPGDVIATGTPFGVGFARTPPVYLSPGDRMEVEIDGLGVLSNPVVAAPAAR